MNECWYALALALAAPSFVLPEDAHVALLKGKIEKVSRKQSVVAPEMIFLKNGGMCWKEIGEIFGYSENYATSIVSHYKKKQKMNNKNNKGKYSKKIK